MSEGARVRWTITIYATPKHKPMRQLALFNEPVGIDLGLSELGAASENTVVEARLFYRALEETLAIAKRANKNTRVQAIHAKIANWRKDFQHKLGARLVQAYGAIFVGNVKPVIPSENDPGQIGFGRGLECIPDHAAVQLR